MTILLSSSSVIIMITIIILSIIITRRSHRTMQQTAYHGAQCIASRHKVAPGLLAPPCSSNLGAWQRATSTIACSMRACQASVRVRVRVRVSVSVSVSVPYRPHVHDIAHGPRSHVRVRTGAASQRAEAPCSWHCLVIRLQV